jgi:arylsulfatase A-like enzyme
LKSYPIHDLGVGDNPLDLKRKLKLGGAEFNVLFSPPKSEYSFDIDIPESCVLDFGIGIVRDKNSEKFVFDEEEKGVVFMIVLSSGDRKRTVFQHYLPPPPQEEDRTVSYQKLNVDLPRSEDITLTLITEGGNQNFSFWHNPVLYQKGKNDHNIILISVDTLRADHLGCYGYERETSPNIDALAKDSTLFANVYASSPWTLPSHVAMLTSLHGVHHQVYHDDEKMDPELITLADLLRQHHYICSAMTGGGFVSAAYGFSKGFDSYNEVAGGLFNQRSAEDLYENVSDWLEKNAKEKNFFLFLHTYQPHDPYACPDPYRSMFLAEDAEWRHINLMGRLGGKPNYFKKIPESERQNVISLYDAEIRYTDEMLIGPLIQKLKDTELYDKTMILVTSDHGEEFYDHSSWGHGHQLYDESLKVPLIIKFPQSEYRGSRCDTIVSLVDVMPTILEEAGVEFPGLDIDGKSLVPVIEGKETEDRVFLADIGDNVLNSHIPQKIATNENRQKFILNKPFSQEDLSFFLHPPPDTGPVELYDLRLDPREKSNIAHGRAGLVNQLIRFIEDLYASAQKRKTLKPEIDEALKEQLRALGYIK